MEHLSNNRSQKEGRRKCCCQNAYLWIAVHFLMICVDYTISKSIPVVTDTQAMMYLSQYGYLSPEIRNPHSGHLITSDTLSKAIMEFQSFVNLNLTGYLDDETLYMMSLPRCAVRDKLGFSTQSRSKRYVQQGTRWKVKDLTYRISKYPKNLKKHETDETIDRAFALWSEVTPLNFNKKSTGQVHIDIRFEVGQHGDQDPFDGPGGTLAHAYFPIYGGDTHFDDTETWTIKSNKGTNLLQVAAHEFGHSLGLAHSTIEEALMAPIYKGYQKSFKLHKDDIEGIQSLYGKRSSHPKPPSGGEDDDDDDDDSGGGEKPPSSSVRPPSSTREPPTTDGDQELCHDGTIDAIFTSMEGVTYVLKGAQYWKLTDKGIEHGYPKRISQTWPGLPSNIDAAFTYIKNGKTYFFKGSKYWKYDGKRMDGEYPKDINEGFTGIPDNIHAAMVWSGNGKIYFFKGSKYWRFDPTQKPPVKSTYPKTISNWEGIPDNIDDAVQYTNGYTYFFKGGQYWRFNDRTFAVDSDDPPFPRNAGYWWFGCRAETRQYLKTDEDSIKRSTSYYQSSSAHHISWIENLVNKNFIPSGF